MSDVALPRVGGRAGRPRLDHPVAPATVMVFLILLLSGIAYATYSLYSEITEAGVVAETWVPFVLLGIALLIALGFEFVNGFHDTANAVATVIYTHSLSPNVAVVWSGLWNFELDELAGPRPGSIFIAPQEHFAVAN
jgi:inorganic phosphate transporter, PiT family